MNKVGVVLLAGFVLTLLAGIAIGIVVGGPPAAKVERTYLDRLIEDYDLAPAQADKVRAALAAEDRAINAVLERLDLQVRDEIVAARAHAQDAIRAALTDAQRARFDRVEPKEEARK
jgi:hypothetical protein